MVKNNSGFFPTPAVYHSDQHLQYNSNTTVTIQYRVYMLDSHSGISTVYKLHQIRLNTYRNIRKTWYLAITTKKGSIIEPLTSR